MPGARLRAMPTRPLVKAPVSAPGFVAYYRVSTDKQAASGLGLAAQRAAVHTWLASHGAGQGQLVAEFEETESGRRAVRPQLLRALAAARRHRAVLVVAKLDRLTRDPRFLGTLRDARVPFVAADNPHATELTVDILAAVAADEARRTAERTRAAIAVRKAQGAVLGRPTNFTAAGRQRGRDQVRQARRGRFLVWVLAHANTLERLAAADSLRALGRALEHANVPTPTGRYEWHPTTVARVRERLRTEIGRVAHAEGRGGRRTCAGPLG